MKILISTSSTYKKNDRIIINAGTAKYPEYWTVTITSVGKNINIVYDDGDKGKCDSMDIVSLANKKKRKTSFGKDKLPAYQLKETAILPKKSPVRKKAASKPKSKAKAKIEWETYVPATEANVEAILDFSKSKGVSDKEMASIEKFLTDSVKYANIQGYEKSVSVSPGGTCSLKFTKGDIKIEIMKFNARVKDLNAEFTKGDASLDYLLRQRGKQIKGKMGETALDTILRKKRYLRNSVPFATSNIKKVLPTILEWIA